jgi:Putative peptidoglycan binding domain/Glycine zipper
MLQIFGPVKILPEVVHGLSKCFSTALGLMLITGAVSCAPTLSPLTEREKTSALGGLAGGATGAIIGSLTGSALAGGLVGIPLGAVAGWYIGDQMARNESEERMRINERDDEIDRLKRENDRLRRESEDIRPGGRTQSSAPNPALTASERVRQAQRALNNMGYNSGPADGVWNARTQAAVRDFQQTRGLEVTGQLNDRTMQGLGIDTTGSSTPASSAR